MNFRAWAYLRSIPKCFDSPYLLTMGKDWVRYQLLPASMHGHRVKLVDHYVYVNPEEEPLKIWSGNFHCIHCKLMGTENTMKTYTCDPAKPHLLTHYRRDYYIPTEEDLDRYMSIRTEEGWWKRKTLQDKQGVYYLERKWIKPR